MSVQEIAELEEDVQVSDDCRQDLVDFLMNKQSIKIPKKPYQKSKRIEKISIGENIPIIIRHNIEIKSHFRIFGLKDTEDTGAERKHNIFFSVHLFEDQLFKDIVLKELDEKGIPYKIRNFLECRFSRHVGLTWRMRFLSESETDFRQKEERLFLLNKLFKEYADKTMEKAELNPVIIIKEKSFAKGNK